MKRLLIVLMLLFSLLVFVGCEYTPSPREQAEAQQQASAQDAITQVQIPTVKYFQERRTIAKWATRWDKPNVPCYVYLISFGKFIGYYVTDGKPASTKSYLLPEESVAGDSYGRVTVSNPDIDGTYGDNNAGIRFFTAEGAAVEWAGDGASYLYSDTPLPVNVPKLN